MIDELFEPNDEMISIVRPYLQTNPNITPEEIVNDKKKQGTILIRKTVENTIKKIKNTELIPLSERELLNLPTQTYKWQVEGLIPEKGITFLAGKRASFKTWTAVHLALGIANGVPVFDKFSTQKNYVLYLDEENGIDGLKEKLQMAKKGMGLKKESKNIGFVCFEGIKLEDNVCREKIENFLQTHNSAVIIVDCFRRIINAEENDATEMNRVFTELIRPITEKFNVTWILIHHLRKGISGRRPDDIMDELRGSSEIVNYADSVIVTDRRPNVDNRFILRHAKSRRSKEQPPYIIELEWDKGGDGVSFNCSGTAEDILDAVDLCCKSLMVWLEENDIVNFKTKEARGALTSNSSFSGKTVNRALSTLVEQGKIKRVKRGVYRKITETLEDFSEGTKGQKGQDPNKNESLLEKDRRDNSIKSVPTVLKPIEESKGLKGQYLNEIKSFEEVKDIKDKHYSNVPPDPSLKINYSAYKNTILQLCEKEWTDDYIRSKFEFPEIAQKVIERLIKDGKLFRPRPSVVMRV